LYRRVSPSLKSPVLHFLLPPPQLEVKPHKDAGGCCSHCPQCWADSEIFAGWMNMCGALCTQPSLQISVGSNLTTAMQELGRGWNIPARKIDGP